MSFPDLIRARHSVRTYDQRPLEPGLIRKIEGLLSGPHPVPFGNRIRFRLVDKEYASGEQIALGTYGFIKDARWFVVGAVRSGEKGFVDFGYAMERIILALTGEGLGTCWLGGSLTRGEFGKAIGLREGETIPAVASVGYPAARKSMRERFLRMAARAASRKPWENLFFSGDRERPLTESVAGAYAVPLEMVRLGPSASNKQPWRMVRTDDGGYHLYLERTPGYGFIKGLDLQLVDMGIAMCHFELAAREAGLSGHWTASRPGLKGDKGWEYVVTWQVGWRSDLPPLTLKLTSR